MTQVDLHSVSVDGGRDEGETSAVLDGQGCQSRQMEPFRELAAGVADDFNNLLTVIAGYSDLLLGQEELSADCRRNAQEIKHAAERAFAVTRQLSSFSQRDTPHPTLLALASLVEGMAPLVKADPVQLEWMFMNLAANARDAMPEGGSLRIEVQPVTRDVEAVVRVIVTDTGCGMDAATQVHLFEPFFTTKRPGQGAGLRLANVYEVVTQSHGAIRVSSEVGQGTSFTIDLPAATEPDEQAEECGLQQAEPIRCSSWKGKQAVRTVDHLQQGYRELEAQDGFAAIRISGRGRQGEGNHDS